MTKISTDLLREPREQISLIANSLDTESVRLFIYLTLHPEDPFNRKQRKETLDSLRCHLKALDRTIQNIILRGTDEADLVHEVRSICSRTFDLIHSSNVLCRNENSKLQSPWSQEVSSMYNSESFSEKLNVYQDLAMQTQGKPSIILQRIGQVMMAIGAIIATVALIFLNPMAGLAGAAVLLSGIGLFELNRQKGLSLEMQGVADSIPAIAGAAFDSY